MGTLLHSIGVVSFALGGLAWAVGAGRFAKRALAFGVVLVCVAEALIRHGAFVAARLEKHGYIILVACLIPVLVVAVARILASRRTQQEPRLAGKRRVARGP